MKCFIYRFKSNNFVQFLYVIFILAIFCNTPLLTQTLAYANRIAIIITFYGNVTLKTLESKKPTNVVTGLDLYRGDSIFVGDESSARLLFMDGKIVTIDANTTLYIDSTTESSVIIKENLKRSITNNDLLNVCEPKIIIASVEEIDSALNTRVPQERRTRSDITPSIVPVLPAKTIYNTKPTFIWFDPRARLDEKDTQHYTLVIYERYKQDNKIVYRPVFKQRVTGKILKFNQFTIPKALSYSATYEWDIYAGDHTPEQYEYIRPRGIFRILDSLHAMEIHNKTECFISELYKKTIDENTYYLLLGSYLKKKSLYYESTLAYEELGKRLNNVYPYEELVVLYKRLGEDTALLLHETIKKAQKK